MNKIEQSWVANAAKRSGDMLEYQNWFDECRSLRECVQNGFIDFTTKIFTKDFYKLIGDPRKKTSLEIGSGGGRLLNAANHFFKTSYGIDILNDVCMKTTAQFLKDQGAKECKLFHRDRMSDIPSNSVDFVYSFIVFQHFSNWDEAAVYLDMVQRVLKPEGAGVIYFGSGNKVHTTNESEFKDRECSLFLTETFVREKMEKLFSIIAVGKTTRQEWSDKQSGQFYVKFRKKIGR